MPREQRELKGRQTDGIDLATFVENVFTYDAQNVISEIAGKGRGARKVKHTPAFDKARKYGQITMALLIMGNTLAIVWSQREVFRQRAVERLYLWNVHVDICPHTKPA